jgi:hypothetical protein
LAFDSRYRLKLSSFLKPLASNLINSHAASPIPDPTASTGSPPCSPAPGSNVSQARPTEAENGRATSPPITDRVGSLRTRAQLTGDKHHPTPNTLFQVLVCLPSSSLGDSSLKQVTLNFSANSPFSSHQIAPPGASLEGHSSFKTQTRRNPTNLQPERLRYLPSFSTKPRPASVMN